MISVLIVVSECYRPTFVGYHCPRRRRRRATPLRFDPLLAMRRRRRTSWFKVLVVTIYAVSVAPAIVT